MKCSDYIVSYLIEQKVTDAFGIPGGVILKLLYAMEKRIPEFTPHLSYHEQMAGFAACGYAQAGNVLGVAYATRGPGITNMITCIAEAYYESIPVLFITAHSGVSDKTMRSEYDQEIDLVKQISQFTKYSARVETAEEVREKLSMACREAVSGRPGAVFLDFSTQIFDQEIKVLDAGMMEKSFTNFNEQSEIKNAIETIKIEIKKAKRPIFLIGDGVRQSGIKNAVVEKLDKLNIPVLSSRSAQDIFCKSELYYGYIGSHGMRYSNFILSKADLIIAIGNRMSFPVNSKSFRAVWENKKVIRLDVDKNEFQRNVPNAINFGVDLVPFMAEFLNAEVEFEDLHEWINICDILKESLSDYDTPYPVVKIAEYIALQGDNISYVCDVGNNEFWVSRAFEIVHPNGSLLFSKAFGTLGSALGRAIGAYYANKVPVICFVGDQGFQYNIQELQYIVWWKLPIKIILLNNFASGMIKDQEKRMFIDQYVHTTIESGYSVPDFKKIVEAYGIKYTSNIVQEDNYEEWKDIVEGDINLPAVYEIIFDSELHLTPILPKGNRCQDMYPAIDRKLYETLDAL